MISDDADHSIRYGTDDEGCRWLIVEADDDPDYLVWICAPVTSRMLAEVESGRAEPWDVLRHSATGMAEVIVIDHGRAVPDHCVRGAELGPKRVLGPGGAGRWQPDTPRLFTRRPRGRYPTTSPSSPSATATLPEAEFGDLLRGAGLVEVVDVRSYPGSRRNPQYGQARMARWLPAAGVGYRWDRRLGGRRRLTAASPNTALRHEAFRAYADHMDSPDFRAALDERVLAQRRPPPRRSSAPRAYGGAVTGACWPTPWCCSGRYQLCISSTTGGRRHTRRLPWPGSCPTPSSTTSMPSPGCSSPTGGDQAAGGRWRRPPRVTGWRRRRGRRPGRPRSRPQRPVARRCAACNGGRCRSAVQHQQVFREAASCSGLCPVRLRDRWRRRRPASRGSADLGGSFRSPAGAGQIWP